ncbi:hypothetical protein PVAND_005198 [Polypedilum vanderplanki]|uniref:Uncharacterized protein n=1 Tax=Polypedilum vanderplanki TaxID=319348 RepID=A0A9J6C1C6_POLVA|nr:hypothetical protein PVAND_005198 [Polypedilum vanderplanki]
MLFFTLVSRSSSRIALPLLFMAIITNIFARPYTYQSSSSSFQPYAHPAVLENDAAESLYPNYWKNPFYKTPRVRAALAHFSRLSYGEQPVENRIADAVPRREIYKLLTHAGFVQRSEFPYA